MVIRVIMAVCALAQVAAVMPYHHHGGSDAPCINPLHCMETRAHLNQHQADDDHLCGTEAHNCLGAAEVDCADICAGHLCLHNTSGHRHGGDGSDCSLSHLDLNPPAKDKLIISAPVLELAWIHITSFPPSDEVVHCCVGCRSGELMSCSVHSGTITLHSSYLSTALPPRAPSC